MTSGRFNHLIGVPYKEKDCWDIARDFYLDVLGVELKHYYDEPGKKPLDAKDLIYTNMGDFEKIEEPKFGCLILLRIKGVECHIGVYVGGGMMLHTDVKNGSTLERLHRWKSMISGYYLMRVKNDKN